MNDSDELSDLDADGFVGEGPENKSSPNLM
jgi:hypothetical protein